MGGILPGVPPVEGAPPFDPTQIVGSILQALNPQPDLNAALEELQLFDYVNTIAGEQFLADAIQAILKPFADTIAVLVAGLEHVISDILHLHLKQVIQDIINLLHKLHDIWGPIIAWLRRLQQIQRQMQLQALKNIVNLIQRARAILAVFRILHVRWATRLDNWLAGIEGKLIAREFDILHKTNEIVDWINWILDPTAFFRTVPLWGTAARDLAALARALGAVGLSNVYPATRRGPNAPAQAVPFVAWANNFLPTHETSTPYYDEFAATVDAVHQRMLDEVGT